MALRSESLGIWVRKVTAHRDAWCGWQLAQIFRRCPTGPTTVHEPRRWDAKMTLGRVMRPTARVTVHHITGVLSVFPPCMLRLRLKVRFFGATVQIPEIGRASWRRRVCK